MDLIPAYEFLYEPSRYKVVYGGRGAAKSWEYARALLRLADAAELRILCAREFQTSINDSVYRLLIDQIEALGLLDRFYITNNNISNIVTGSLFLFKGLKRNIYEIKSTEGVDICWVEEGQMVSNESWGILIPTIRKTGSEIWCTFNTGEETDPTYERFVTNPPPNAQVKKINYWDNPHFEKTELQNEMEYLKQKDYESYLHIWEGEPWSRTDAQVLGGCWRIDIMDTEGAHGAYFGADFGFSSDPSTLIKCWIIPKGERNVLYIEKECYEHGVEIDDYEEFYKRIPESEKHEIRADNARPELISHIRKKKFRISAAQKWGGSVEDGISYLRNFDEIVINPACTHTIQEAREWKYKTDKLTGDVLPVLIDANNHCWDAVRYALQPLIKPLKEPQMRTT